MNGRQNIFLQVVGLSVPSHENHTAFIIHQTIITLRVDEFVVVSYTQTETVVAQGFFIFGFGTHSSSSRQYISGVLEILFYF